ncbi:IS3 family transposase [Streptomyces humidus]|uniref:IS3 family transposase n=1 Tax=Streptomyces humidus TaxID=52259 RepID=UPI00332000FA
MLKLSRAGYYAWLAARLAAAARQRAEDELAAEIREIHATSRGAYGAPRVHAALRRKGHAISRKKVERIMRERDIRGVTRRRRRHLTVQDTKAAPAPDLVRGRPADHVGGRWRRLTGAHGRPSRGTGPPRSPSGASTISGRRRPPVRRPARSGRDGGLSGGNASSAPGRSLAVRVPLRAPSPVGPVRAAVTRSSSGRSPRCAFPGAVNLTCVSRTARQHV